MYEVLPVVKSDIENALTDTARTFGLRKLEEYVALIEQALRALDDDSEAGKRLSDSRSSTKSWCGQHGRASPTTKSWSLHHELVLVEQETAAVLVQPAWRR